MNLYLVQHAKAKSKEESPERPLTDEGYADIKKVAGYVAKHASIQINQIFHSGKTRARQTAEVLASALQPSDGVEEAAHLKALDDPSVWARRLSETDKNIALVGHKPYMPKLAALLLCQDENKTVVDFQKGGVVCLSRDAEDGWLIQWIVTPQIVSSA